MLQAIDISYAVSGKILIEGISTTFETGKLYLIIGPNGAGKSTFIKVLGGLLVPSNGQVIYNSGDLFSLTKIQLARQRAVLSQNIELSFPLKVEEIVMMGRYPHFTGKPCAKDRAICLKAMEFFDVTDLSERDYTTLSGGEQQRVHFARVLTQVWEKEEGKPRLLLLDEPLTSLDVKYQYRFMQQLTVLIKENNLIVIGVVHDLNLAANFADHLLLLQEGRLVANGQVNEVLTPGYLKKAYSLDCEIIAHKGKTVILFNNDSC